MSKAKAKAKKKPVKKATKKAVKKKKKAVVKKAPKSPKTEAEPTTTAGPTDAGVTGPTEADIQTEDELGSCQAQSAEGEVTEAMAGETHETLNAANEAAPVAQDAVEADEGYF